MFKRSGGSCRRVLALAIAGAGLLGVSRDAQAVPTVDAFYAGSYSIASLGSVSGLPAPYGGLTFLAGDNNTLLIGGNANDASGALYSVPVTRGADNHITGLGPATLWADAAYIDGGLAYAPNSALLYTGWPVNTLGQIAPGGTTTDKTLDLTGTISSSVGALGFVPAGQPGEGSFKMVSYDTGDWYDVTLVPDGSGTFDIGSATYVTTLVGGPEGFIYVPMGSALFPVPSILVAEWNAGFIAAYDVDAFGDPIAGTRRDFVSGLIGAEGALIDPLTGDFLFSTFGGGDQVFVVSGFVPPAPVPEPIAATLAGAGLAVLGLWRRSSGRRRRR